MMQMRFKSKIFALLMAGILACGSISYPVSAQDVEGQSQQQVTETKTAAEKQALDESKEEKEEPTVQEDQTEKEEPTVQEDQTEKEEPTVQENQTEKEEPTVQENQTEKEEPTVQEDQTEKEEPTVQEDQTEQEEPTVQEEQMNLSEENLQKNSMKGATDSSTGTTAGTTTTELIDITNTTYFTITYKEESYTYTGKAITPDVTIVEKEKTVTTTGNDGKEEITTIPEKTWKNGTDYTITYANNINASTDTTKATMTVTPKDTTKYKGSQTFTFTINPKNINDFDVSMEGKDKVYKGRELNADVNMYYNSMKLERSKDYRVQNYTNNLNVGTATGVVTGIGNYTGQRTMTFNISAQSIRDENLVTITPDLSEKSYKFNGEYRTPSVTLTFKIVGEDNKVIGSYTLKKDVDYTITYEDNKKVGMAGVMIVGKGNFNSSYVTNFKIRPQTTTLKKLEKAKKSLKATWAAKDKQVTGYVVMCSTKKDFSSNVKKAKVKKKITTKTFKNLKSKKKYFVRVRTYKNVNGITYYSNWSNVMKITTK